MLFHSQVSTRDEALSETLHGLCCDPNTPVCMIRGVCPLVDIDLQLFSSKSIAKAQPAHEMEVREQVRVVHVHIETNYLLLVHVHSISGAIF